MRLCPRTACSPAPPVGRWARQRAADHSPQKPPLVVLTAAVLGVAPVRPGSIPGLNLRRVMHATYPRSARTMPPHVTVADRSVQEDCWNALDLRCAVRKRTECLARGASAHNLVNCRPIPGGGGRRLGGFSSHTADADGGLSCRNAVTR